MLGAARYQPRAAYPLEIMMVDELSEARRKRASNPNDITPRDAILEALKMAEGNSDAFKGAVEHAVVLLRTRADDGKPGFIILNGGGLDADQVLGFVTRVQTVMASTGAA